jgi:GT2 family glycosyltransferase
MNKNNPQVSLLVINWNGEKLLRDCLDSLLRTDYDNFELIVVDNNSTDNSIELLRSYGDKIKLICNPENSGYAKGCNIGIKESKGKYISTLNNDIAVVPDWLTKGVSFLESHPEVGAVSPRQMNYFERDKIDILFSVIHRDLSFIPFMEDETWNNQIPVSYVVSVNGASGIWRKSMLDELSGFNEVYHSFYEETDLCLRALVHGWKCAFVPDSVVYHMRSESYKSMNLFVFFLSHRNRRMMLLNNYSTHYLLSKLPILLTIETYRFIKFIKTPTLLPAYCKAIIVFLKYFFSGRWKQYNRKSFNKIESYYKELELKKFIPL